jgi:RNA polymerase sigma factor (sigma-70 family)
MEASRTNTTQIQALLVRAGDGDADALDQVICLAAERLERLTRRMLRKYPHLQRWEQTDDVFQTAVLRLQRSLQKVKPDCLRALLGLATLEIRRTLIDLLRHHFGPEGGAANYQSDFQAGPYDRHPGALQNEPDCGDAVESLEMWTRFHEAVESLAADEREVMHLGWYAGMKQAEMAAVLDVSVSTVKRRWYRARLHLRAAMAGQIPPFAERERDDR